MRHNKKFNHLSRTASHRAADAFEHRLLFDYAQKNHYDSGQG